MEENPKETREDDGWSQEDDKRERFLSIILKFLQREKVWIGQIEKLRDIVATCFAHYFDDQPLPTSEREEPYATYQKKLLRLMQLAEIAPKLQEDYRQTLLETIDVYCGAQALQEPAVTLKIFKPTDDAG